LDGLCQLPQDLVDDGLWIGQPAEFISDSLDSTTEVLHKASKLIANPFQRLPKFSPQPFDLTFYLPQKVVFTTDQADSIEGDFLGAIWFARSIGQTYVFRTGTQEIERAKAVLGSSITRPLNEGAGWSDGQGFECSIPSLLICHGCSPHLPLRQHRQKPCQHEPADGDEEAAAQQRRGEWDLRQQDEDQHHEHEPDGRVEADRVELTLHQAYAVRALQ
jgi:hypothetical protein